MSGGGSRAPWEGSGATSRRLVVSVDIGTTFTAASFCILQKGKLPKFEEILRWPKQSRLRATPEMIWITPYPGLFVILTTPTSWGSRQQNRMRQAAIQAGLVTADCGRRVKFVTDAEVAVLYAIDTGSVGDWVVLREFPIEHLGLIITSSQQDVHLVLCDCGGVIKSRTFCDKLDCQRLQYGVDTLYHCSIISIAQEAQRNRVFMAPTLNTLYSSAGCEESSKPAAPKYQQELDIYVVTLKILPGEDYGKDFLQIAVKIPQIPSLQSFIPAASPERFELTSATQILVDARYASSRSSQPSGLTLLDFARTFHKDLEELTLFPLPPVRAVPLNTSDQHNHPTIVLTLDQTNKHTLYSGAITDEGYDLTISNSSFVVSGSGSIGVWWGTRTLLQQLVLSGKTPDGTYKFPVGSGRDSPGWEVRGFMLDAGRHWYEADFLGEYSAANINEFHIHASDNLWIPEILYGPEWRTLYSSFRFQPPPDSSIYGLVPYRNESWPFADFSRLQSRCAQRGVTVIPEIDTPAHSLVISQWKPQLMINGTPDVLNLTYPPTIPTIQSIWAEFLPWFTSSEVHIGADEYAASLADPYIAFVNEMSSYIEKESGKGIRVWGTYEPSSTSAISTNVTIQHWDFPDASIPVLLLEDGYRVINSEQAFLYLEGKIPGESGLPQTLNITLLFSGADAEGGGWAPNIFSASDGGNNTEFNDPGVRGAIFALWNDWGPNSTTPLETYYQLSQSLAVFAEKTWAGSGVRVSELTVEQFEAAYPTLNAWAPGQNLNRVVKGKNKAGDIVFAFGRLPHFPFDTGVDSVGPPYSLSFSVRPTEADVQTTGNTSAARLFWGKDSELLASLLTFSCNGEYYPLSGKAALEGGKWTDVVVRATKEYTSATMSREGHRGPETYLYQTSVNIWGDYLTEVNMSFAAPSRIIGSVGFGGDIANVVLRIG
ncbi:glycoside hydrolase superfamily [Phlebopus sp. FC_14]|nr:glycoside hydrolase superfamily [Phlebopus sp. FC_14]